MYLYLVDRRLGDDDTLGAADDLHRRGLRLILDGVFHHVGRDFWAFADVRERRERSAYRDWFFLDFDRASPEGDPFAYEGWDGLYDLVKLNLDNPEVRDHLFAAVDHWIDRFRIDGLRLDAADRLDLGFQRDLARHLRARRPDFWLMGEVVHGDYRHWANPETLDATTNYECYKGLYSSHNDRNYFEIAYSLDRQSGPEGIYRDLALYTFADNHDVDRVASRLRDPAHLYPLHALLFTMPSVPSVYCGGEWGLPGRKAPDSDAPRSTSTASARPARTPTFSARSADWPRAGATTPRSGTATTASSTSPTSPSPSYGRPPRSGSWSPSTPPATPPPSRWRSRALATAASWMSSTTRRPSRCAVGSHRSTRSRPTGRGSSA